MCLLPSKQRMECIHFMVVPSLCCDVEQPKKALEKVLVFLTGRYQHWSSGVVFTPVSILSSPVLLLLDWKKSRSSSTDEGCRVGGFLQQLPSIHTQCTQRLQPQWLTRNILSSWSWMSFIPGKAATPWIISMKMQPTPLEERTTHDKVFHSRPARVLIQLKDPLWWKCPYGVFIYYNTHHEWNEKSPPWLSMSALETQCTNDSINTGSDILRDGATVKWGLWEEKLGVAKV